MSLVSAGPVNTVFTAFLAVGITFGALHLDANLQPVKPDYQTQTAKRRFLPAAWSVEYVVRPSIDSDLGDPQMLDSRSEHHTIFDYSDLVVRTFGPSGNQIWKLGRRGQGPYEFANPVDLKVDGEGSVWVLDAALARMTIIASDGHGRRMIRLPRPIIRFAYDGERGFWGFGAPANRRGILHFDSLGRVSDSLEFPRWVDSIPRVASDVRATSSPDGTVTAVGFYYTGRIFLLRQHTIREIAVPETLPIPKAITFAPRPTIRAQRLAPGARPAIRAMTADNQRLYVLWDDADGIRGRTIDTYQLPDGVYVGSYRLPESAVTIARTHDGFVAVRLDSLPEIVRFRERK